jgi:hypothetical protein
MRMQTILHRYVAPWVTAGRRIEAIVLYRLINTVLSRIRRLVVRFGIRLRCFLLIDTAPLFFISPTLRTTHARSAAVGVFACDAHVSMISRRSSIVIGSIPSALRPRPSWWAARSRHGHPVPIRLIIIISRIVRDSGWSTRVWWCKWAHRCRRFSRYRSIRRWGRVTVMRREACVRRARDM